MSNDMGVEVKAATETDTTREKMAPDDWLDPARKAYACTSAPGMAEAVVS